MCKMTCNKAEFFLDSTKTLVTIESDGEKLKIKYESKETCTLREYYIHQTNSFGLYMNTKKDK